MGENQKYKVVKFKIELPIITKSVKVIYKKCKLELVNDGKITNKEIK